MKIALFLSALAATLITVPGNAATKNFGVTSFDAIRVEGDYLVDVTVGTAASVSAEGDSRALDNIEVDIDSHRTLVIREKQFDTIRTANSRDRVPVRMTVRATALQAAGLIGNGRLSVDGLRAVDVALTLRGNGLIRVENLAVRNLAIGADGAGRIEASGTTQALSVRLTGAATIAATDLAVSDLTVVAGGTGGGTFAASRSATIKTSGLGTIDVNGDAACLVENSGLGEVYCGKPVASKLFISGEEETAGGGQETAGPTKKTVPAPSPTKGRGNAGPRTKIPATGKGVIVGEEVDIR